MFTQPTTSPPTLAISDDPASSAAPSRPSRLRGLSYLRQYTQSHLSSELNQHPSPPSNLSSSVSPPASSASRPSYFVRSSSYPGRITLIDEQSTPPQQTPTSIAINNRQHNEVGSSTLSGQGPETLSTSLDPVTGQSSVNTALGGIARIMGRRRSGSTSHGPATNNRRESDAAPSNLTGHPPDQMPTIKLIPHQDPRAARPSLVFPQTSRMLPHEDCVIRVGRYSERDANPNPPPNVPSAAPVGFKSKVVSRRHCEFWCSNGQWYIKDVKSSSGTFLNHIRLSQPSVESRPFPVNDGDVIQLGIDFRGGEEMIFRCVKIRVECNRAWQKTLNNFNVTTHKRLRDMAKTMPKKDGEAASTQSSECSICLMSIAPCQALFVAPCSHVWHYKCIRPILNDHKSWPQFLCPNCRAVADLESDVEDPDTVEMEEEWDDNEIEPSSSPDISAIRSRNDVLPENASHHDGDESMEAMSSRLSSVRLEADASAVLSSGQNEAPKQSLLSRRNARQISPAYAHGIGEPIPERSEDTSGSSSNFQNYLRPIAPSQPLMSDDCLTPNDEFPPALGASPPSDIMVADGPMTPMNNAGPFVFDGSAGREEA